MLALGDGPRTESELAVALGLAEDDVRASSRAPTAATSSTSRTTPYRRPRSSTAPPSGHSSRAGRTCPTTSAPSSSEWWLDDYTESVREALTKLRDGHPAPGRDADYAYLLLAEAEDLVRSQERVYLWPCDCRTLKGACDQSVYNCIRFANDRDLGWEISKERAIAILHEADAAGLTHTDYVGLGGESDPHAICNCCTDCCQPHLAAERLGMSDIWPRRRHVARLLPDACTLCGTCTERCPFGALTITAGADGGEALVLTAAECRGCGLCATGCPETAIAMEPRDGGARVSSSPNARLDGHHFGWSRDHAPAGDGGAGRDGRVRPRRSLGRPARPRRDRRRPRAGRLGPGAAAHRPGRDRGRRARRRPAHRRRGHRARGLGLDGRAAGLRAPRRRVPRAGPEDLAPRTGRDLCRVRARHPRPAQAVHRRDRRRAGRRRPPPPTTARTLRRQSRRARPGRGQRAAAARRGRGRAALVRRRPRRPGRRRGVRHGDRGADDRAPAPRPGEGRGPERAALLDPRPGHAASATPPATR